jgi:hypothetical protein
MALWSAGYLWGMVVMARFACQFLVFSFWFSVLVFGFWFWVRFWFWGSFQVLIVFGSLVRTDLVTVGLG